MTNYSLTDFEHNPKYFVQQIKEIQKPIVLTVNGKAEIVIQDTIAYQKLLERLDYAESVAAIRQGITEFEQGNFSYQLSVISYQYLCLKLEA
ncbi:type II toxin-antitoxin system Phd/YefM family antitoxin [Okeania sp. KiyG1]|uniref:type II toxin-antitoxin system Phd/YefM family antitoxin n=1 Tax=Okeania sp. KiyG1 TaxID=2720165 RepID=UPI001920C96C|nr:type II toxin-antitoxin system Phd/YefM family antitoxin [Okeania sp. KiyG1]GFZ94941.1 hypothetical protein CYANOKiyG1_05940 [Okeania sp. KiyG1]